MHLDYVYTCLLFSGLANDKRQLTWNQSASADCARTKVLGLVRDQRLICQRNPDLMPAVAQAAREAVDICQELFADRRWNCSTVQLAPNYLPDLALSMFIYLYIHKDKTQCNLFAAIDARSLNSIYDVRNFKYMPSQ
jgi:wnt family